MDHALRDFRRAYAVLAAAGLGLFVLHAGAGLGGASLDRLFAVWVYDALLLLACSGALARALAVRTERLPWSLLAAGMAFWAAGDTSWDFVYGGNPPTPSVADGLYLAFYPCCYAALLLLVRSRLPHADRSLWFDGITATLAASALGAAVLVEAVVETTNGPLAEVATNIAYPVGDTLLLGVVAGVFALSGWRLGRTWIVLAAGMAASAVADGVYLFQSATGTYVEGRIWDALWPASMLLLGWAGWHAPSRSSRSAELEGKPHLATSFACGLVGIGILAADHFHRLNPLAAVLAGATLAAVLVRAVLTFRENRRILERIRTQSITDELTGLGNRRKLVEDLAQDLADGLQAEPRLFVLFDLNGFKRYNDTFGHLAGDALLARLGRKLAEVVQPAGSAYRLGGDELCLLAPVPDDGAEPLIERAVWALSEHGEAFQVSTAYGAVLLPEEAVTTADALRVADQRLYARKRAAASGRGQPHEVLLQALFEREPQLHAHVREVAGLAVDIGRQLGLSADELEELRLAAELHDVGKLAVPDAVLRKPGPLTLEEWTFIEQHTVVGQRILAASPALGSVAEIVRRTHERWDGNGYDAGLAGEEIPLAARIIAVCDAYTAMTSRRPYRLQVPPEAAVEELKRCAGTQFDPTIVPLLVVVLLQRQRAGARKRSADVA